MDSSASAQLSDETEKEAVALRIREMQEQIRQLEQGNQTLKQENERLAAQVSSDQTQDTT